MFQLCMSKADVAAASAAGRMAYTYVDFTTKQMLPYWIPSDAVGGNSTLPGSEELTVDPTAPMANMTRFTKALKCATAQPRFLRSISQWVELW